MPKETNVKELLAGFVARSLTDAGHVGEVVASCPVCGKPIKQFESVDAPPLGPIVVPCAKECDCSLSPWKREDGAYEFNGVVRNAYALSALPSDCRCVTFDNWDERGSKFLKKMGQLYCEHFDEHLYAGTGFVVCDVPGVGKTHMLRCIAHFLAERGHAVTYATHQEIMAQVRETYSQQSGNTEGKIFKKLLSAQLLIIDELGVGKPSEWMVETTYKLVDMMYRSRKPMLFATNLDRKGLAAYFTDPRDGIDRITPRILERSPLIRVDDAVDYRAIKAEEAKAKLAMALRR